MRGEEHEAFERVSWDEALCAIARGCSRSATNMDPSQFCRTATRAQSASWDSGRWTGGSFTGWAAASLIEPSVLKQAGWPGTSCTGRSWERQPKTYKLAKLIIAWGANIHGNNVHLWPMVEQARRNGARLIVIDPYKTRTAALADWHIAIRPGTDVALALGMMHVILREGLEDRSLYR